MDLLAVGENFINLFIGYDDKEPIATHVLIQSITCNTTMPFRITLVGKKQLAQFNRIQSNIESTPFSLTRFLVPWMSNFQGWSLYCDGDFVFEHDLAELWSHRNDQYQLLVCKHEYEPAFQNKKNNHKQTKYAMKNWSSLILFNNSKCKALSPQYVFEAEGLNLHQFKWVQDHSLFGELPKSWNYLVGEENQVLPAKGIHFTNGLPLMPQYSQMSFSKNWFDYYNMLNSLSTDEKNSQPVSIQKIESVVDPELLRTEIFDFGKLGRFQNIPLVYKAPGKKSDYLQLRSENTQKLFLLKFEKTKYRNFDLKIPFIKLHCLGSEVAGLLGLKTQDCQYLKYQNEGCILIQDIRNQPGILGMEPISYSENDFNAEYITGYFWISNKLEEIVRKPISNFFTRMIIFDLLIANTHRDARSVRVLKEIDQSGQENFLYDILIENCFGLHYMKKDESSDYGNQVENIASYIIEHNTFKDAYEMIERISLPRLSESIQLAQYLSDEEKLACLDILKRQHQLVLELKALLVKFKLDVSANANVKNLIGL